jgi:tetratricopeptide (TPR) repeat protein
MKRLVRRVIGERGSQERAHYLLGVAYLKTDRIAQAIPEYLEALKLAPNDGIYHAELAYCYLRSKKIDLAKAEAQKALELSGQNRLAHLISGIIQAEAGDLESALGNYKQALAIAPDDPQVHWNLAQAYLKKGDSLMGAYHLGLYARLNLEPDKALEQLRHAQKLAQEGSEMALHIQKQMDEILREGL